MKRYRAHDGRFGEWLIYTCADCGEIRGEDPCFRCGNDKASVSTVAISAERLRGAVEEIERLREGLRNFGIHAESCPRHRLFDECTCGLLALELGGR